MRKMIFALIAASALALLPSGTVLGAAPGWQSSGSSWYYYNEDGSLLRDSDTPDGFRTDGEGRFAGEALGGGPFPVLQQDLAEEASAQKWESDRLYAIAHPELSAASGSSGSGASGPAGDSSGRSGPASDRGDGIYGTADNPRPDYRSIWSRSAYAGLRSLADTVTGGRQGDSLSGRTIAGMPIEFFMLSVAGETSGSGNLMEAITGDRGRAYGPCQYDYRYDLVDFMNYAHGKHPELWSGLAPYLGWSAGDVRLVQNAGMRRAFRRALLTDRETYVSDQLEYMRMLYWDGLAARLNEAGFRLDERSIAISAALFSVSVNCGPQPEVFARYLSPSMTDAEFLDGIYRLRNTVFADQRLENRLKETNDRFLTFEPDMAADLLLGRIGIDSEKVYGSGVEWYGDTLTGR